LASRVASSLRARIVSGELSPDTQLRVQSLAGHYDVAISPVREALNRLVSEKLVAAHDMRGFFVSPVSESELDELTRTRCWLNEIALRQSLDHGGARWEEAVVLGHHRLARAPRRLADGAPNPDWAEAHRVFHRTLTEGCRSQPLIGFCDQLFMEAERYRNLSRQAASADPARRDDEHRLIVDAVLARDLERATGLLNDHFVGTANLCRSLLRERAARGAEPTSQDGTPP
jgi:DNA-binding GntR family transcriptional regulator